METDLSASELERYKRHLVLPEIGKAGQKKLKRSRVLVVGAGGLGSPVILYLAAAGVGRLGIVDFDCVDATNLQRQVLFCAADVGDSKVETAARKARQLNPDINVVAHNARLSADNLGEIFENYDVIVDGSDNFPTRYLVNDACVLLRKANVHGAVHRFAGEAAVFAPGGVPCYRCIFPQMPAPGAVQNCQEAGVLGVLPGIVGSIQAAECLKTLLGIGSTLAGRLLMIDALDMRFQSLQIKPDPACTVCGATPEITSIEAQRYEDQYCTADNGGSAASGVDIVLAEAQISADQLRAELANGGGLFLLDVRESHEFAAGHIENAVHIPLGNLASAVSQLPAEPSRIVVYCLSGKRSQTALELLSAAGKRNVRHLTGGFQSWLNC